MKNIGADLLFSVYRGLSLIVKPIAVPYLSWRAACGKEEIKRCRERLGRATKARPHGPLIWLHAVSVGETMALTPLIERILALHIGIVLTTNSVASARLAKERFADKLIHQYVPFDFTSAIRRFLDYWKPDLVLVCESEIWPIRISELARRRIPQIMINARLSERSYDRWKQWRFAAKMFFSKFAIVICQSEKDAVRYRHLGAVKVAVSGNLKADVVFPDYSKELALYRQALGQRPSWAAISTHQGEELMAARVHRILCKRYPDLLTIIVPRHVERIPEIIQYLKDHEYSYICKSTKNMPEGQTEILLGDTIGEMGFYLHLTEIAFVGKSLTAEGGHNPLEPALAGTAILSGPNIENFKEMYQEFTKSNAAHLVDDATMLAGYIHHLLDYPEVREKMIQSGKKTAARLSGGLKKSFDILEPFLYPLIVSAQLNKGKGDHDASGS